MIIRGLRVERYGVWRGLELGPLADGLNVFYGPNEAGKTTLLHFLRSMLFGFSPRRRARYPALDEPAGGTLELDLDGEPLVLERLDGPQAQSPEGRLTLTGPGGGVRPSPDWPSLRGPLDEDVYARVFAVGLRELQELGVLGDAQSARLLFDMSAGLEHVGLQEALSELDRSRERIWSQTQHTGSLARLLAEHEQAGAALADLAGQTEEYLHLATRCEELRGQIEQLESERSGWVERLEIVETAGLLYDRWKRRQSVEHELRLLGPLPAFPVDGLTRLEDLNAQVTRRRGTLRRWKRRQAAARKRLRGVQARLPRAQQAARVAALVEQQPRIEELAARIEQLRREIEPASPTSGAEQGADSPWMGRLADLRTADWKNFRELARRLADAGATAREAAGRRAALATEVRAALGEAGPSSQPGREEGLDERISALGELVSKLRRRVQLDERLGALGRHRQELREQSRELLERQLMPPVLMWGLGGLVAASAAMILSGWLFRGEGAYSWSLGIWGGMGLFAAGFCKWSVDRRARLDSHDCAQQLEQVEQDLAAAGAQREALDRQLPTGGGPLAVRLQAAERDLTQAEGELPLRARQAEALARQAAAETAAKNAAAELSARRREWRQALRRAGLPEDLRPRKLRELRKTASDAKAREEALAGRRHELAQRRAELEGLAQRIAHLAADLGLPARADPLEQLRRLAAAAANYEALRTDRRRRRRLALLARARRRRATRALAIARMRRRSLLAGAGTQDEAQFRRLAAQHAQGEALRRELDALRAELSDSAGERLETVLATLEAAPDRHRIESERDQLASRGQAQGERIRTLAEERGRLLERMELLAADRSLARARFDLATLERRILGAVEDYQVQTLTARLIREVRERFERERQPAVLQAASRWFARLTRGRFTRVWTPLGERTLRVDDEAGGTLPVEALSRGTREQLFLALRLALVAHYAQAGLRLPVVLDDVLVNCDAARSRAAAAALKEFAAGGNQLLLFTCHDHMARLFKALRVPVTRLPRRDEREPPEPARPKRRAARGALVAPVEGPADAVAGPVSAEPQTPESEGNGHAEPSVAPARLSRVTPQPAPQPPPPADAAVDPPAVAEPEAATFVFGAVPWIDDSDA